MSVEKSRQHFVYSRKTFWIWNKHSNSLCIKKVSLFWSSYLICTVHWCQEQNRIYTKSFALNNTFPCKYSICSKQVNNLCSCDFPSVLLHIAARDILFGVLFVRPVYYSSPITDKIWEGMSQKYCPLKYIRWYSNVIVILQSQLWHKNRPLFSQGTMPSPQYPQEYVEGLLKWS